MTEETRSVVVERLMPHPPDKIWRALTEAPLIAEWLMQNDFAAKPGHRFTFHATPVPGWKGYTNCEVVTLEPPHCLAYRWGDGTESDSGLKTLVTWTLTPQGNATLVRMEHSGFRPQDEGGYRGMGGGWPRILERLETVAARVTKDTVMNMENSVVVEREIPHPPEKVWRALTQPDLIAEWLMKNDFEPVPDHRFKLSADWGSVDCQVMTVEPNRTLSYTWGAYGVGSVVTWTLTPTRTGTHLRMEQSGFRPDQQQAYYGARAGWPRFIANLEEVVSRIG